MSNNVPEIRFKGYNDAWVQRKLGEVCGNFKSGNSITANSIYSIGDYPVYGGNGMRGYTDTYTHEGEYVLVGRQGALCGNINTASGKVYISEHAVVINENEISDIGYLEQLLIMMRLNQYSESSAQPGLSVDKLKKINVITPIKKEQTAIGDFFRTLDDAITLYKRKLDGLKDLKKGYLQQMFPQAGEDVPRVRFAGVTEPWEQRKLGELVERITRKNTKLESERPLTISAQYGLIDQNVFFDKQVASKDVSGYYLLQNGDFAYNKSYSNGYPWGAVKRLDKYDMGVLSTLYIVFKPIDIESEFLAQYYETSNWHIEVGTNTNVRICSVTRT